MANRHFISIENIQYISRGQQMIKSFDKHVSGLLKSIDLRLYNLNWNWNPLPRWALKIIQCDRSLRVYKKHIFHFYHFCCFSNYFVIHSSFNFILVFCFGLSLTSLCKTIAVIKESLFLLCMYSNYFIFRCLLKLNEPAFSKNCKI